MNEYEQKKQARIARYRERAAQSREESSALTRQAISMQSAIPPGQPLLVDHHSYKSAKRFRERIDQKMGQAIAAQDKAAYYEEKADAAENNTAISSDDPAALEKLTVKLEGLKASQEYMKKVNAYYRKHQTCRGCRLLSDDVAAELDKSMETAYAWETAPYPSYVLSNNNQEIHRIEKRIQQLTQAKEVGFSGWEFEGGKVVANSEKNRLQVFFDAIPPEDVRQALKGHGFRWARSEGAWQRQLSDNAIYSAKRIPAIRPKDGSDPIKIQPKRKPSHQR